MSESLPERPSLRHLKGQARDLLKTGAAASLADAQRSIARRCAFPNWPKLKAHVEALAAGQLSLEATSQLKDAIDRNDLEAVKALMTARPELHQAPLGRGKNGPLTLAVEYRAHGPQPPQRLAIARWMLGNGSDVHRGGDAPLISALRNSASASICWSQPAAPPAMICPGVMDLLRGRIDFLTPLLVSRPDLIHRRCAELDFGASGERMLLAIFRRVCRFSPKRSGVAAAPSIW